MQCIENALKKLPKHTMTETENGAAAFEHTGSACLDFFFKLVRGAPPDTLHTLFENAWLENPENALKILLHCRDCRKGKGERAIVLECLKLLRRYKPRTYLKNLQAFLSVGYYQDLLNIVKLAEEDGQPILGQKDMIELELFAEQLLEDEWHMENKSAPVTLAAKWAPTESHSDDRNYEFSSRLAKLMFPSTGKQKIGLMNLKCAGICGKLKRYRQLLTPLRKHLRIVENQMAHNQWSEIEYSKVPAKSHRIHTAAFKKHDLERYNQYLQDVADRKTEIKSTGLQPHELIRPLMSHSDCETEKTIKCQWNDLIDNLRKGGKLGNVLPLCDVSGSMRGEPMEVCIALGLVIAELSNTPFKDMILTFESTPQLLRLKETDLKKRVLELKRMPWGGSTNLTAAFDQILDHAIMVNCSQDQLPKMLIIFSDMQFDEACPDTNENPTIYQNAKHKFEKAGYKLPSVVFWNLRGDTKNSFPVTMNEDGVALLSGYSAELLKVLMENPNDITPIGMLNHVLDGYQDIVIPEEDKGSFDKKDLKKIIYKHVSKRLRRKPRGKGPGSERKPKKASEESDSDGYSDGDSDKDSTVCLSTQISQLRTSIQSIRGSGRGGCSAVRGRGRGYSGRGAFMFSARDSSLNIEDDCHQNC